MTPEQKHPGSQLFTLRLWRERLGDDLVEVRCQVRHVMSGETRHFRDWSRLAEYLCNKLSEPDVNIPQP